MASDDRGEKGLSRLISGTARMIERLPGGSTLVRSARIAEETALQLLRDRLRRIEQAGGLAQAGSTDGAAEPSGELGAKLRTLLDTALEQTRPQARHAYFSAVLAELLPDEARMLAALSDGSVHPLIHLGAGPALGGVSHRVLENRSLLPRTAGVAWPDLGPRYIAHLRELELIETGKEDPAFKTKYEMLEADALVRATSERISKEGGLRPRVLRRTVKLSDIGRQFWEACQAPGEEAA